MYTASVISAILIAILLILITSLQSSKKEGLAGPFGSMGANQFIGAKQTSDLLEQITWGLLVTLIVLSLSATFFLQSSAQKETPKSIKLYESQEHNALTEEQTKGQPDSSSNAGPRQ